ncbi:MAG TPA: hypothetical protein VFB12_01705 [Ktedonobacteraceae bacterium]|nr:hypothetical protein [Ktedonobacteraceae bacterium]
MTISQPTTSPFETTREAATNEQAQGVGAVRGTTRSGSGDPLTGRTASNGRPPETIPPSEPTRRHIVYPAWPTSQPGPQVTAPLPGQHPHRLRTDQMVYSCYDQERGMPCVSPPESAVQTHRGKTSLPDERVQEVTSESALERWQDDGGTASLSLHAPGALKASRRRGS